MKSVTVKEIKIGISVLVALVILIFGIDFLKGVNVFKAVNYYYVSYNSVEGLSVSAPVTLNGFRVGQVRDMTYDYEHPGNIKVEISLDKELKLPQNTRAILTSDLLGTASIALQLGQTEGYLKVGDVIQGEIQAGMLDAVSQQLMPSISQIFPKIDTLLTTVNALAADPALKSSIGRLDGITADLRETTKELAMMSRRLSKLPDQINGVLSDANDITGNVKDASGNLITITSDVQDLTGRLKSIPVDNLVENISTATDNLRTLSNQLNDPHSSLGLLMRDPAMYNNINATINSLDSLLIDVKKNPKRYINIKVF